jgi:Xaa-Pro aminopeptidase
MSATAAAAPVLDVSARATLVNERIELVRALLRERGASAIKLDARRDFAWLTVGGRNHILYTTETGVAPVVVTLDGAEVLAPVNEYDRIAEEEIYGLPLGMVSLPWWQPYAGDARAAELAGAGGGNGRGKILAAADVADELTALRSVLSPSEHERMAWLAAMVLPIIRRIVAGVVPGTREDAVVADALSAFSALGIRVPVVLTASDERIDRYRHPLPSDHEIWQRLMLVVVVERWGLHVAHTEFVELDPRSDELNDRAAAIASVLEAMRIATTPGQTLGGVLEAAQRAYRETGMPDEWSLHHQGGTIGYQARERVATPQDPTVIQPGMAFAWNPSTVGFKREETLYLDGSGAQHVLTTTP